MIKLALILVSAYSAVAQPAAGPRGDAPLPEALLGTETYRLWQGDAPGALGKEEADIPTITVFHPHPGRENGTAVIIAPGGAYRGLAFNLEGRQVADWFAARGVTAFVLKYRLGKKYLYPVPLVDARRAIRLVRSRTKDFGINPERIGIIGFSAGGHLAAMAAVMPDGADTSGLDPVDRVDSRPDFLILGYPWLNAMQKEHNMSPYCSVLGVAAENCRSFDQYSPDLHVSPRVPPTFIYHTTNDKSVPVDASVTFYRALAGGGVDVEMHLFAKGIHGSGLGMGDPALDEWPALLEFWMRSRGLLPAESAPRPR